MEKHNKNMQEIISKLEKYFKRQFINGTIQCYMPSLTQFDREIAFTLSNNICDLCCSSLETVTSNFAFFYCKLSLKQAF